ncbi:hypothetical protein VYU27_008076 [Nannochloropsis oceanica]
MLHACRAQASMLLLPARRGAASSASSFLHLGSSGSSSSSSSSSSHPTLQQVRHNHRAYDSSFLQARRANYQPLSPLSFLERTAKLYPRRAAVAYR